jgi:hypothetical protein
VDHSDTAFGMSALASRGRSGEFRPLYDESVGEIKFNLPCGLAQAQRLKGRTRVRGATRVDSQRN